MNVHRVQRKTFPVFQVLVAALMTAYSRQSSTALGSPRPSAGQALHRDKTGRSNVQNRQTCSRTSLIATDNRDLLYSQDSSSQVFNLLLEFIQRLFLFNRNRVLTHTQRRQIHIA